MLEKLYTNSPIFFQNFIVAVAGFQLHFQRKGGNFRNYLQQVRDNQLLSPEIVEQNQLRLLKQHISNSFSSVPFYQDWSRNNHITAEYFNSVNDLSVLPIIEKDDIRKNPQIYCSSNMLNKAGTFTLNTSGTTGKPLIIFCDRDSRRHHFAYWERFLELYGVGGKSWRATFCGRIAIPQNQQKPPFWRYDPFQKNVLFSSYHLSEQNMPFYLNKLRHIEPLYLDGYPSSLAFIANFMLANNEPPIKNIRAIFTSAETLLPLQRNAIGRAFQAPVADQYGCTEMAVFIFQCPHGTYHVNSDYSLLEVIDKNGDPALPGEWGEAVCTVFVNKTMPLIRYRLGDVLRAPEPSHCPCGLPFPVVKEILGRKDDMIHTPDGRQVGRLDPAFKGIDNICETQIVQIDIDNILVRLVATTNFSDVDKQKLLQALKVRLGDKMMINIELLNEIPREANRKFKAVISKITAR